MRGSLLATSLYGQWGTPKPGSGGPRFGTRTCRGKHKGADKKGVGRPAGAMKWSGLKPQESESRAAGM